MELKMFNAIADVMQPLAGTLARDQAETWLKRVEFCAVQAGYTICDLKPLGEVLHCEPEMGVIVDEARSLLGSLVSANRQLSSPQAPRIYATIAQALNWERTEFDTLDELLVELQASEAAHSKFVDSAIEQNELMETVREKLQALAELSAGRAQRPLIDELMDMLEPRKGGHIPASEPMRVVDAQSGFEAGGYVKDGSVPGVAGVVRGSEHAPLVMAQITKALRLDTHTLLHAGELYREVTILLHTEQLVAWRTADGQEYSAPAHRVLLDPDEDGLAAELLSRITGYEIAPEHMAELRAQMGVTHG